MSARTELASLDQQIARGEAVDPVNYVEVRTRAEVEERIEAARRAREATHERVAAQDARQAARKRVTDELPAVVERIVGDTTKHVEATNALGYSPELRHATELASLAKDTAYLAQELVAAIVGGDRQVLRPAADLLSSVAFLRDDYLHLVPEAEHLRDELRKITELVTPVVPLVDR